MLTFLDRLKIEKNELLDKITKLSFFLNSAQNKKLSEANDMLLRQQLKSMKNYYQILIIRIELNNANNDN